MYKKVILLIFLIGVLAVNTNAQWTEPIPITSDPSLMIPRAVAIDDTIHVVATTVATIYYLRSNNNGISWTDPINPPDTFYSSWGNDIFFADGTLCIAFYGRVHSGDPPKCYFMKSSDGGRNWNDPVEVFHLAWKYPRLAAKGDTLFYSICLPQIILMRSYNSGINWDGPFIIEADSGMYIDSPPNLFYNDGRLHAIYQCGLVYDSVGIEVYYRLSDDHGQTWSERIPLSTPEPVPYHQHSQSPSATIDSSGNILALWFDYKYGSACGYTGDILGRISTDNGESWLPETRITHTQTGSYSTCLINDNVLYSIWMDDFPRGCDLPKLMYAISDNWGNSWTIPEVIDDLPIPTEYEPFLLTTGDSLSLKYHCIFRGNTFPGHDLFYTNSDTFTDIVFTESQKIPDDFGIRVYPNPFNSQTVIAFNGTEGGENYIEIYDINGRLVKTLDLNGTEGGDKRAIWDATDALGNRVSSGIYFARATGGGNNMTIKLVYLK
ncbi:MAG: T9SS type A sorting domain-containing protein [Candidatus Zixiibacteriota bacterium]|nr:MAG: T9SS type A sorting domain-containing protein [candidate division Zixibacteria bacterium]